MARQIGLKDIHIAVLSKDDSTEATYEKPEKLERAISAKLTPKSNSDNILDLCQYSRHIFSNKFYTTPLVLSSHS